MLRDDAQTVEELRRLELVFAGEVLAVFVHEVNNRLATLQEKVGLLGDLLGAAGAGKAEGVRESLRVAAGLEDQIALIAELTRRLDGFSRRLGAADGRIELPAALEELLELTDRRARQKTIRIEKDFAVRVPPLRVEPATFLFLIHHLVSRGCALLPPHGALRLRTVRGRGESGIGIDASGCVGSVRSAVSAEGPADGLARRLVLRLGGRLEEGRTHGTIMIWFPDPT